MFKRLLLTLCFLLPGFAQASDRTVDIQCWTTTQGTAVSFVANDQLPMVDILVTFAAGSARDGEQPGIANLTAHMLNQGAANMNASAIAEQFDSIGAIYSSHVDRDMAVVSLRSLSNPEYLQPALQALSTVVSQPTFSTHSFTREQLRQLVALEQKQQYPRALANDALYASLYANEPYAEPVGGTIESVQALSADHLRAFHQQYYVASNAIITIVGDLNTESAKAIAETLAMQLPTGEPASTLPTAGNSQQAQEHISFPAEQTTILLGQVGISHHNEDYFPLLVGNYIFGGGPFISRLYNEVREKRGLVYSVSSRFTPLAARGPFVISLSTENQQAQNALALVNEHLIDFLAEGPSEEELQLAQDYIIGNFSLQLDSNAAIASTVLRMRFYQLPEDYLDTYQAHVAAVTLEQVKDAFQAHVTPEQMATILVGSNVPSATRDA